MSAGVSWSNSDAASGHTPFCARPARGHTTSVRPGALPQSPGPPAANSLPLFDASRYGAPRTQPLAGAEAATRSGAPPRTNGEKKPASRKKKKVAAARYATGGAESVPEGNPDWRLPRVSTNALDVDEDNGSVVL